VLATSNR